MFREKETHTHTDDRMPRTPVRLTNVNSSTLRKEEEEKKLKLCVCWGY